MTMVVPSVLVDIDGTLCDPRGRDHLLDVDKDWEAHSLACEQDPPIEGNIALVRLLARNHNIILCSGRSVIALDHTKRWMKKHGVPWTRIMLRPIGNRDNNATYKVSVVKKMEAEGFDFVLALDDYHKTVKALLEYGIPTVLLASQTKFGSKEDWVVSE